ncbi:MAG TPA: hypothetical protein DCL43_16920 [Chitinophagaceae bacterium]|nr:hypothetical protein [Chitinophagaceae bacterium]
MTTQSIADRLVALCRQGQYEAAQNELYHADAESFEPNSPFVPYVKGLDAIKAKGEQFQSQIETFYGTEVSDPLVAGNYISCSISLDCDFKGHGRVDMREIALYEVKDGKIVKETFYY